MKRDVLTPQSRRHPLALEDHVDAKCTHKDDSHVQVDDVADDEVIATVAWRWPGSHSACGFVVGHALTDPTEPIKQFLNKGKK